MIMKTQMMNLNNGDWWPVATKWSASLASAAWALIEPAAPYLLLCTAFVLLDCWSACALGRRVARAHPEQAARDAGKIKSWKLAGVFSTLVEVYAVVLLAHFAQLCMPGIIGADLRQVVAAAVCGWQFWSYLENKASCNGARWARLARKFLADKTSRHLNIHIED